MNVKVRFAAADDIDDVVGLIGQLAESSRETSPLDSGYAREYFGDDRCKILLAESGNEVVGLLSYHILPNLYHAGNCCLIGELVVADDSRGQGIGHALMAAVMEQAVAARCVEIGVGVLSDNVRAVEFYHKHGLVDEAILLERHF